MADEKKKGAVNGSGAATASTKPVIFISYSHKDEPEKPRDGEVRWLSYVQYHLAPAVKSALFDLWVDEDIPGGDKWKATIAAKLNACDVCVLLVSPNSLASDYIIDVEVKTIRKRQRREGVPLFPIVLKPFAIRTVPWLMELNLRPPNGESLWSLPKRRREKEMVAIVDEIVEIVAKIADRKSRTISVKRKRIRRQLSYVPGPVKCLIDISHLPETPYKKLVGRDAELNWLDQAWACNSANVCSLVGPGGTGKSALVSAWLIRLHHENYRGADTVLGWSFYSQGSRGRATSADAFLNWALDKLGITLDTTSASAKGEAIAEALAKRRVLLLLDGVEPLQHGPGPQVGQLKDLGLRALLRRFAATPPGDPHGLIVLTSRLAVADLARWKDSAAPVLDVEQLSDEAGAALLRDNGLWGTDEEIKAAAQEFGGNPLPLVLLSGFLREQHFGDVRRRDRICALLNEENNPLHAHAEMVLGQYEKLWLRNRPPLLGIMHIIGLFYRPTSADLLNALRKNPVIHGLTDAIVGMDDAAWKHAVNSLREARLLSPQDESASGALDAHPLVREWFGESLRKNNEKAWRAAHSRLFEHLRDTTQEGDRPTLEDLAPLYQAIAHGCRAGRYQEALAEVYKNRICRRLPDGALEFYSSKKLGALGSDLAAITWFFEKPYETPVAALSEADRSWVLGEAAFGLRAQGRFAEALPPQRASLEMFEAAKNWRNAASAASNLSEAELIVGEVPSAVATAERAVAHADRSGNAFQMMANRTALANALHAAGQRKEAEALFADAERRQREWQRTYPLLYSLGGYWYCDLLLGKADWAAVLERCETILNWEAASASPSLLDKGSLRLSLGRAHLGLALAASGVVAPSAERQPDARMACARLDEAVEGLRAAGTMDMLPVGLLARAACQRSIGDWAGAKRDLDEVEEIAESGPMKLHLCDMAIERARLAFAQIEAFAPLNGLLEKDNPPKPAPLSADDIARLKKDAAEKLQIAADYISSCGYHRRDEELAELQAVLRGERKFAGLPPRV